MPRPSRLALVVGIALVMVSGCSRKETVKIEPAPDIGKRLEKFAPVDIEAPWQLIGERNRPAVEKLFQAAKIMDELFLRQVYSKNPAIRDEVTRRGNLEEQRFFRINAGPWDRIDGDAPVLIKATKPPGANFYPEDMTKDEFEAHLKGHPEDTERFEGTFTVIRRTPEKGLKAVPYATEWSELVMKASRLLEEAADLVDNESLAKFLRLRAAALLTDNYYESDMAWMDVAGSTLEVTIGPYEVYEDNIFNYKGAYEAFICVNDPAESQKLEGLKGYLLKMEQNLPIDDRYKNLERGAESPICIVDEIFSAGDTKAGVQTIAFNLPNDERVREAKGSKKVMLRNVCRAKFEKILVPIAQKTIVPEQLPYVTFDAYFDHVLLHEFSHGLGPGKVKLAGGTEITVNKALKELYSGSEEAKADIVGAYNISYLVGEKFFPVTIDREAAVTFLAGFFRTVRFGADEAHGKGSMVIFNYLVEKGAYVKDPVTGLWSVDFDKVKLAVRDLSKELLTLQARGDYEGMKAFFTLYGTMGSDVKALIDSFTGIPVDIEPRFALEKEFAKI